MSEIEIKHAPSKAYYYAFFEPHGHSETSMIVGQSADEVECRYASIKRAVNMNLPLPVSGHVPMKGSRDNILYVPDPVALGSDALRAEVIDLMKKSIK